MSVTYTAVLDVSEDSVLFLSGLLHAERIRRGTREDTRALSTYKQAVLALRWLFDDTRISQLARDNGIGVSTAYDYRDEAITVLAARKPSLRGALFSAVSDNRFRQFASSYESRFGEQPFRLATLGYDAVLLTLRIARDWQPGRDFPTGRMLAADGFLGLDGPFRFGSNGVGERAMEVREVGNGAVSVVDAARTKF